MIKLFVSDMDGTLLTSKHIIDEPTINGIKQLQKNGIEFLIATGRGYSTIDPILVDSGIQCSIIGLNGAILYNEKAEVVRRKPLNTDQVEAIIKILKEKDILISIVTEGDTYSSDIQRYRRRTKHIFGDEELPDDEDTELINRLSNIIDLNEFKFDKPILKIQGFSNDSKKLDEVGRLLADVKNIDVSSSFPDNLEITHYRATKGEALTNYMEQKNYRSDEVIVVGDSLNDLSMLEMVPNAYVMANSHEHLLNKFDNLTLSNDEYGVLEIMKKFQLI